MTITGKQIRAARGLLGWSMEDLSARAGVTTVTIRKLESDAVQPQEKTLASILAVFDKHGVEFLDDDGVRLRKQHVRYYSGKSGYKQLLDHVYETLKGGGRICQFNFGDMRYLSYADDFISEHLGRMAAIKGLDARVLEVEGSTETPLYYCRYRNLPKKFAPMAPYYIYNDYIVQSLNETGGKREFISVKSKLLTERYVAEFDLFWGMSAAPGKRGKK